MGLPGWRASLALAIAMLWDAVSDLLLGHWSDKTRSRLGRRHPFMYAALVVLPISFWAIFNPPSELFDETSKFAYILVFAILIRTGTTLFEVPSVAQLPELETEFHRRSRWLALRHALGWYAGSGIHTINLFLWVGAYGFAEQTGYSIYAAAGACLISLAIIVSALGTQAHGIAQPPPTESFRFSDIAREVLQIFESIKNKNFAALFLYGLISGAAGGLSAALYLYNTRYFFGFSEQQIGVTGAAIFLSPLLTYIIVPSFSLLNHKKHAAVIALLVLITLYPLPYLAYLVGFWPGLGSWVAVGIFSVILIIEVSCIMIAGILMDSMMADVVENSEVQTSRRSEGLFYAARGFGAKAISALGIISAGLIVSMVGMEDFRSELDMTYEHRVSLVMFFLPLYCGLNLVSLFVLSMYKIHRREHELNLETIAARKTESEDLA